MSELICLECSNIFWDAEAVRVKEYIDGHLIGYRLHCPCCGSEEYEEADHCHKCGGSFLTGKLFGNCICEDCVREYMTIENLKKYAESDLNAFAEWMDDELELKRKPPLDLVHRATAKDKKKTATQGE